MVQSVDLGNTSFVNFNNNEVRNLQLNGTTIWQKSIEKELLSFTIETTTVLVTTTTESSLATIGCSLVFDNQNYNYDFALDWGDGVVENYTTQSLGETSNAISIRHDYPAIKEGTLTQYTINIKGLCEYVKVATNTSVTGTSSINRKSSVLIGVHNINDTAKSMEEMFADCLVLEDTTILLPRFVAPLCTTAEKLFGYEDIKSGTNQLKNGTFIVPDNCFIDMPICTNFAMCFGQGRDADDDNIKAISTIKLGKNIFPASTTNLREAFVDCVIASPIPEDFLYNLTNLTNLEKTFGGIDNTGYVLPSRWFPANMSSITNMFSCFGGIGDIYKRYAKIYGVMENIWDRADLNANLDSADCFLGASTLDNYNEIPSSWGGGRV
jgi:hypothetical protein